MQFVWSHGHGERWKAALDLHLRNRELVGEDAHLQRKTDVELVDQVEAQTPLHLGLPPRPLGVVAHHEQLDVLHSEVELVVEVRLGQLRAKLLRGRELALHDDPAQVRDQERRLDLVVVLRDDHRGRRDAHVEQQRLVHLDRLLHLGARVLHLREDLVGRHVHHGREVDLGLRDEEVDHLLDERARHRHLERLHVDLDARVDVRGLVLHDRVDLEHDVEEVVQRRALGRKPHHLGVLVVRRVRVRHRELVHPQRQPDALLAQRKTGGQLLEVRAHDVGAVVALKRKGELVEVEPRADLHVLGGRRDLGDRRIVPDRLVELSLLLGRERDRLARLAPPRGVVPALAFHGVAIRRGVLRLADRRVAVHAPEPVLQREPRGALLRRLDRVPVVRLLGVLLLLGDGEVREGTEVDDVLHGQQLLEPLEPLLVLPRERLLPLHRRRALPQPDVLVLVLPALEHARDAVGGAPLADPVEGHVDRVLPPQPRVLGAVGAHLGTILEVLHRLRIVVERLQQPEDGVVLLLRKRHLDVRELAVDDDLRLVEVDLRTHVHLQLEGCADRVDHALHPALVPRGWDGSPQRRDVVLPQRGGDGVDVNGEAVQ